MDGSLHQMMPRTGHACIIMGLPLQPAAGCRARAMLLAESLRSSKSPMKPPMRLRRHAQAKKLTEPGRVLPRRARRRRRAPR